MAATSAPDTRKLRIAGMDCGSCALTIENSMRQLPGVEDVSVSFATESMELRGSTPAELVERRLRELGYRLADTAAGGTTPAAAGELRGLAGFLRFLWSQPRLRIAALAGIGVLLATIAAFAWPALPGAAQLDLLHAAVIVVVGAPVFSKGFRALLFARRVTIDLLMAIATLGALFIGEGGEAVTVILLFTLGEALEAYSASRARDSLRSLMALQPQEATLLEPHHDDHGAAAATLHYHQRSVPVERVVVGDRLLVKPGQRIPVDGEIVSGSSAVNQAAVTGESMPVDREPGDEVLAGTVNGSGALEIVARRPAGNSTIARIARLVEEAQAKRSPAERFIDRFAQWYTPAVVALAMLVVAIPVLALGQPLLDADGSRGWLYRGLALLIIACPCALIISIPVTVVSALTRLANLGILVKGGAQLDRLADVCVVAFDKTGTLTRGRPAVTAVRGQDCSHDDAFGAAECAGCDDVVALAAAVEGASEHPVAHAIVSAATARQLERRYRPAGAVTAVAGRGVTGELAGGQRVAVGNAALFPDRGSEVQALHGPAVAEGNTLMYVARDDKLIGYIGVQDEVRHSTAAALAELKAAGTGVRTAMLTGDSPAVARRVAGRVGGIDEVRAGLLPEQKLAAIEQLRERYGTIAMVGDGINDAPALARADVGIAMGGSGTAQAMETADVVLMQDDLSHVPAALRLARLSRRLIKQNIVLSLGLKLAFLALAVPGLATLWMAVVADVGATLLVTLNGMRMLRAN
jgi:Cd2+/Zn2+-exporting ATPase